MIFEKGAELFLWGNGGISAFLPYDFYSRRIALKILIPLSLSDYYKVTGIQERLFFSGVCSIVIELSKRYVFGIHGGSFR